MAGLHEERLVASTVFSNLGVDYFGPFTNKDWSKKRKALVLSIHMPYCTSGSYRICTKLDTGCCLNAIMRFIARRGKPVKMTSDNGTNFVGAEKELAEYIAAWNKRQIEEHLIQQGIR